MLLEAGASASEASPEGETALMVAARTGKVDAVNALLARGADPNVAEKWRGQTALMWAAAEGHAPVIEALVARGAKVRCPFERRVHAVVVRGTRGQDCRRRGADESRRRHERLPARAATAGTERRVRARRSRDRGRMPSCWPRPTLTTSSRHGCSTAAPIPTPRRRATPRSIRSRGSGKPESPAATTPHRRGRATWTA